MSCKQPALIFDNKLKFNIGNKTLCRYGINLNILCTFICISMNSRTHPHTQTNNEMKIMYFIITSLSIRVGAHSSIRVGAHSSIRAGSHSSIRVGAHSSIRVGAHSSIRVGAHSSIRAGAHSSIRVGAHSSIRAATHNSGQHTIWNLNTHKIIRTTDTNRRNWDTSRNSHYSQHSTVFMCIYSVRQQNRSNFEKFIIH
jgi:hypothetical protein